LDNNPSPDGEDFEGDEDGELDDENGNSEEGSGRTGGVWLSERNLKSLMVDAAQTVLRLQRKPLRKGQRNGDEPRKRRDALE